MTLPLELWNALVSGIHPATWSEVQEVFGKTPHRQALMAKAHPGLLLLRDCGCQEFLIDGSFVGPKPEPGDIDVLWVSTGVRRKEVPVQFLHSEEPENRAWLKQHYGMDCYGIPEFEWLLEVFSVDRNGIERGLIQLSAEALTL